MRGLRRRAEGGKRRRRRSSFSKGAPSTFDARHLLRIRVASETLFFHSCARREKRRSDSSPAWPTCSSPEGEPASELPAPPRGLAFLAPPPVSQSRRPARVRLHVVVHDVRAQLAVRARAWDRAFPPLFFARLWGRGERREMGGKARIRPTHTSKRASEKQTSNCKEESSSR